MSRLFVLILLGLAIWLLLKRAKGKGAARSRGEVDSAGKPERMLVCARCGVHAPASDGVTQDGVFYCCVAHSRNGDDNRGG